MNTYTKGTSILYSVTLQDTDGTYVDPGVLSLTITDPDGVETVLDYPTDITKTSTGHFEATYTPDAKGIWLWKWLATGANAAAVSGFLGIAD